ncbi:hypothetical protein ACFLUV_02560 [Elusimicrobiota bacterium]
MDYIFKDYIDFKASVKESRSVFSVKKRLFGLTRNTCIINEVRTKSDGHYKHIQLTAKGIQAGWGDFIENALQCLPAYEGTDIVPQLIFADPVNIVVKWIDGVTLKHLDMSKDDYAEFGSFLAKSIRDYRTIDTENIVRDINRKLGELYSMKVIGKDLYEKIKLLLSKENIVPEKVTESICFGDVIPGNYVRDESGGYHYIDVFGIYRVPLGRVFAKQLYMIRPDCRKAFSAAYFHEIEYDEIRKNIAFYHIYFLLQTAYSKSGKKGFVKKKRGIKKANNAVIEMNNFVKMINSEDHLSYIGVE